ncbi:MAG TPA: hypothetical protein ENN41_04980, partial [Sediminispirochaeta sp.]|nr:hypothetical protein [Sediminispirochaeta sp.]
MHPSPVKTSCFCGLCCLVSLMFLACHPASGAQLVGVRTDTGDEFYWEHLETYLNFLFFEWPDQLDRYYPEPDSPENCRPLVSRLVAESVIAESSKALLSNSEVEQAMKHLLQQFERSCLQPCLDHWLLEQVTITEDEISEAYHENREQYATPEKRQGRNIFVEVGPTRRTDEEARALAESLLARIKAGTDFDKIADEFYRMQGDEHPEKRGLLPPFDRCKYSETFSSVAFALEEGEVSQIIELPRGYCIVKITKRSPSSYQSLPEVRGKIVSILQEEKLPALRKQTQAPFETARGVRRLYPQEPDSPITSSTPLFQCDGKTIYASTLFAKYPHAIGIFQRDHFLFVKYAERLLSETLLMADQNFKRQVESCPEYQCVRRFVVNAVLCDAIISERLAKEFPAKEDLLRYYEEQKEERFKDRGEVKLETLHIREQYAPERNIGERYYVERNVEEVAQGVRNLLSEGKTLREIAEYYQNEECVQYTSA